MADASLPDGYVLGSPQAASADLPDGYVLGAPEGEKGVKIDRNKSLKELHDEALQRVAEQGSIPYVGASSAAQGHNLGLAGILGAPVDILNNTAGAVRNAVVGGQGGLVEDPFGGSAMIKRGMQNLHMIQPQVNSVNDLPENYRWLGKAAEVVGGTLPTLGLPLARAGGMTAAELAAAPRAGLTGALDSAAATAAANPGAHISRELGTTFGMAQGAGIAEDLAPDNAGASIAGQVLGGVLQPGATLMKLGAGVGGEARKGLSTLTKAGQEREAANRVVGMLTKEGEDPAAIATRLMQPNEYGVSAAELSDSPVAYGMRQAALKADPNAAKAAELADQMAQTNIANRIRGSVEPGDPNALTSAAAAEQARVGGTLANRAEAAKTAGERRIMTVEDQADALLQQADDARQAALAKFNGSDQYSRVAASRAADEALDKAWTNARATENALWNRVPKDRLLAPQETLNAAKALDASDIGWDQVNGRIKAKLDTYATGRPATAGQLIQLRSDLLTLARDARAGAQPNRTLARTYNDLAGSVLDDLATVPNTDAARAFSRRFHDTFDRTYAGQPLRTTGAGGEIDAAQTLEGAFAGNAAQRAQRFQDLSDATKPMPFQGGATKDLSPQMQQAQEQYLRAQAARFVKPDGTLNQPAAATFVRDHGPLLDRYPTLKQDMQQALETTQQSAAAQAQRKTTISEMTKQTQEQLQRVQQAIAERQKAMQDTAFAKVLKAGEKPTDAIASALKGPNPTADYGNIARLAAKGGPDAVAGLRAATFDHLNNVASGPNGLNFTKLRDALTAPQGNSGKSLLDLMTNHGVLSKQHLDALNPILERGTAREALAANAKVPTEPIGGMVDDLVKTGIHAAGARLFAPLGKASHSHLLMASAGSKFAEKFAGAIPAGKVGEHISAALNSQDPSTLLRYLQTGKATATMSAADKVKAIAAAMASNMGGPGPARIPAAAIGLLGRINQQP